MMKEERMIKDCTANNNVAVVDLDLSSLGFHMIFDMQQVGICKTINDYTYGLCTLRAYLRVVKTLSKV